MKKIDIVAKVTKVLEELKTDDVTTYLRRNIVFREKGEYHDFIEERWLGEHPNTTEAAGVRLHFKDESEYIPLEKAVDDTYYTTVVNMITNNWFSNGVPF